MDKGVGILKPVLKRHGFRYRTLGTGKGSGGVAAWGEFYKGNRRLELHFRRTLGLVTYHITLSQDRAITHEDYMWSVIGRRYASEYPGFGEDPLSGFRDLASDLSHYAGDFLKGSDTDFLRHFDRARELQEIRGRLP